MMYRCRACGTQFEGRTGCPRCGLPVTAQPVHQEPTAPPPPSAAGAAPGPPPAGAGSSRRRVLKAVGVGALALLVVVGSAFAAMRVFSPGGTFPLPQAGGTTAQLTVTGEPPDTAGSWASGVRQVWRVPGNHSAGDEERDAGAFGGLFAATAKAWTLIDVVGDISFGVWAFDPASGKALWNDWGSEHYLESCASTTVNGLTPCLESYYPGGDVSETRLALVDLSTGKVKSQTPLRKLGIKTEQLFNTDVDVVDGQIVLTLPQYPNFSGPDIGRVQGVIVARVNPGGDTAAWVSQEPACGQGDWEGPNAVGDEQRLQHDVYFTRWGLGLNFATGETLAGELHCVAPAADGVLLVRARQGDPIPTELTAPDGFTYKVVDAWDGLVQMDRSLPSPLALADVKLGEAGEYGGRTGTATLAPAHLSASSPTWVDPPTVSVASDGGGTSVGQVSYDGQRLYILDQEALQAVDPASGESLWRSVVGDAETYYKLSRMADGTILLHGYRGSLAVDPGTGAVLWYRPGDVTPVTSPDGVESLFQIGGHDSTSYLARLDPADRPSTTPTVPADTPDCPSGMTAISWTQYADGAILLCRLDQTYAVVFPAHPDWVPTELNFSPGGHDVAFTNGTRVRVSLGGRVVTTEADGTVTAQPVTSAWNDAVGRLKAFVPSDLRTCPAGSWPISLSTYQGGWLLVCGTAADAPTSMLLSAGSDVTEVGSVTYRNGGYCGTAQARTICGYRSPAVVSVTTPDGTVTQHSADSNYFDGHGAGGTGQGNGSYGVETPDDNAKDQVRYLTEILEKSMAGRTNLQSGVDRVRTCTDLDGAISSFNDVLANRQELLDALDSAPVDAVPDGQGLTARLRDALQLSHDSDEVWLQWAQTEQANGCADGQDNPLYQQVRSMNGDVAVAKQQFLAMWNQRIAPTYHVRTFTVSQI